MSIGGIRKYWDGKSEDSIIESPTWVCDFCKNEYDFYVVHYAAIPPAGIMLTNDIFICDKCINEYFINSNDIFNTLYLYKKHLGKSFADKLLEGLKYFLPHIFRLQRYTINKELREKVLKKCGFKCVSCGSNKNLTIDHIKPYSKGGETKEYNLQVLCKSCNSKKGCK
jgi:hypothetical protein